MKDGAESLGSLLRDILNSAGFSGSEPAFQDAEEYFCSAARLDYAAALRKQFDRRQLLTIFSELRRWLPALNQEVFAITDLRRLAKIAADLGAVLGPKPFEGPEGRSLRGFYVPASGPLKRPLICVNTASHPAAAAAAFWHEMGHHLTHQMFGDRHQQANLSFSTNYPDHLQHPGEIVADLVMTLGGYPKPAAKRLFDGPERQAADRDANVLLSKARRYARSVMRYEFRPRSPADDKLHVLAGMIHVAKLRAVLLQEYGI